MGVAKTAAFAADVFNDLLEVRAGRGWYFPVSIMENGCTWRFSTSMLVLSHDEKSPFLVAKPGHLGSWRKLSHAVFRNPTPCCLQIQWRTDRALAELQEPDAKSDGTSFLDLF